MARGDLVLSLVQAAQSGDRTALRQVAEALIAEERSKQHHVLAERLENALRKNGGSLLRQRDEVNDLRGAGIEVVSPTRSLDDLILSPDVRVACENLIEEQQRVEVLRSYGLEPRHRILLTGPPGNGKTTLAEAIAESLVEPMLKVRYEAVIASFLGETGTRLSKVFEHARTRHCVLFFDEFDAIAKERGDEHETGEIKRVVSSLLMQVDELPSHVVVVAASNHPELLDRAVGRRFQLRLSLGPPSKVARRRWFEQFAEKLGAPLGRLPETLAQQTRGAAFSELEDLTTDILRRHLLHPEIAIQQVVDSCLASWGFSRKV